MFKIDRLDGGWRGPVGEDSCLAGQNYMGTMADVDKGRQNCLEN